MFPRRYFFEQACGVIAASGRSIPIFTDKHLAYNWTDALWMYERAKELQLPFMAGSSAPLFWRNPVSARAAAPILRVLFRPDRRGCAGAGAAARVATAGGALHVLRLAGGLRLPRAR